MEIFLDLINDIWDLLKLRKKYWLAPLIITILAGWHWLSLLKDLLFHRLFIQFSKEDASKIPDYALKILESLLVLHLDLSFSRLLLDFFLHLIYFPKNYP